MGSDRRGPIDGIPSLGRLEEIARREIKEKKPPQPRRRVFLSFRGEDEDVVDLFRDQAKSEFSDLDFIDLSVRFPFRSKDAEYIRRGIRERIRLSSVTIVLIRETTYKSDWVDWEIKESLKLGKGIIAVNLKEGVRTPKTLVDNDIKPLPWDQKRINEAIQEAARD